MADLDIKCSVCGRRPSFDCREHFVADLSAALARLSTLATGLEGLRREHDPGTGCVTDLYPKQACRCGASTHNERVDALAKIARGE